jgi:hypothetical protein
MTRDPVMPDEPDIWKPYAVMNPLVDAEKTDVPEPFLTDIDPDETIDPVVNTSPFVTDEKYVAPPPPPVEEIVI